MDPPSHQITDGENFNSDLNETQATSQQQELNGTSSISSKTENVDSGLGEYITKQYGLLKEILSFLTSPRDIWNAKQVNSEWSVAADAVSQKDPVLMLCSHTKLFKDFRKPVIPKLIIYQCSTSLWDYLSQVENYCSLHQKMFICPCTASNDDTLFVNFPRNRDYRQFLERQDSPASAGYAFWKSIAIILPSSEKINVSKFFSDRNIFDKEITDALLNTYIGGEEPIKALIVISKASTSYSKKNKWIKQLMNKIIERQGETFAFGGGDIAKYKTKMGEFNKSEWDQPSITDKWDQPSITLIAFRGSAVTAHSAILSLCEDHEITRDMQEFSARVGPHPEKGATRIAFIAQCVDRRFEINVNKHEAEEFERFFPNIPQFGFHAYGEYGINSQSSAADEPNSPSTSQEPPAKQIRLNDSGTSSSTKGPLRFSYSGTTSFVILTFNKI